MHARLSYLKLFKLLYEGTQKVLLKCLAGSL